MMKNYQKLFKKYLAHTDEKQVVIEQILKNLPLKSLKILDIGAGTGFISNHLAKNGHKVTAIDIQNSYKQEKNQKNPVKFIQTDIFNFPLKKKFDLIICAYLFWEIPFENWHNLFKRLFDLIKPNGQIFIIDILNETGFDNTYFNFDIHPENPDSKKLNNYWYEYLEQNNIIYKKIRFGSKITADSANEMYDILKFFFSNKENKSFYLKRKPQILKDFESKKTKNRVIIEQKHALDILQPPLPALKSSKVYE